MPPVRSSARRASPRPRRAHRALGADDMLAAMLKDIEAFNAGVYEDDATLIVAALCNRRARAAVASCDRIES